MSAPGTNPIVIELDALYAAGLRQSYIEIVAGAILLHDTVITLNQEIELIWKRGRSPTTFLFVANRVSGVMWSIAMILFIPTWSQLAGCMGSSIFIMITQLFLFLIWASFSALRVYTVGSRAWRPAVSVFLLALVPFGTNLYDYTSIQFSEVSVFGLSCDETSTSPARIAQIFEIATRVSVIAADLIVLLIIWRHTYSIRKLGKIAGTKTSLANLLLRDGTVFFGTGLALNVAQLGTFLSSADADGLDITYLVTSASCMITSRCILSLRQLSQDDLEPQAASSDMPDGTLQFVAGARTTIGEGTEPLGETRASCEDPTEQLTVEARAALVEELRAGVAGVKSDGDVLV